MNTPPIPFAPPPDPPSYTGSPSSNLGLILYANLNLFLASLRALTPLVGRSSSQTALRALVDRYRGGRV